MGHILVEFKKNTEMQSHFFQLGPLEMLRKLRLFVSNLCLLFYCMYSAKLTSKKPKIQCFGS